MSGANLTTDITITAPTGYEVSKTSAVAGFAGSQTLTPASGTVATTTIYVRLTGVSVGSPAGNVTNASTGATQKDVAVTGTVSATPTPAVTVSTNGPLTFNALAGTVSTAQSYTVSGANLTTDITITAPTGYEVSKTSAVAGFAGSQTLTPSSGTVATTTIFVRLTNTATGTPAGNVTNVSTTASQNVAVTGTVVAEPTTAPAVAVSGSPGTNTVTLTLSGGNGTNRLLVVRPATATAVPPTDQTTYTANLAYGSGSITGTNNFVVLAGTGTTAAVTGLASGVNYVADVYAYNAGSVNGFQNYLTAPAGTVSFTTTVGPCLSGGDFDTALPSGWAISPTGAATRSTTAADIAVGTGAVVMASSGSSSTYTTAAIANPQSISFYLGVTSNANAKQMKINVSTTSQTTGFTTVYTYGHNTTGDEVLVNGSYNLKTIDLSAYNGFSAVYVQFERVVITTTTAVFRLDEVTATCGPIGPNTTTGTITGAPFCVPAAGTAISVPFTVTNGPFTSGNVFTAVLSNASGSFASGTTTLGTLSGTTSGTISGTIPTSVAAGTAYRVRVEASTPTATGVANTANLEIRKAPTNYTASITGTLTQSFATTGAGSTLSASVPTASFTPIGAYDGVTLQWRYGTSPGTYTTNITGQTGFSYSPAGADFAGPGIYYVAVEATATCGGLVRTSTNEAVITITAPAPNIVVKQGVTTFTSGVTTYNFGSVAQASTSTAVTFTIQNTGSATLTITTPLGQTGDFAVTAQPATSVSAPSGSTTFQVTFTPTAQGTRNGTVTISSNDPTTPTFTVNLTGTGAPSAASDVIFNSGFSYNSSGIDYAAANNQLASITNTSQGTGIYGLTVRDGGGASDADNLPTILTGLTFSSVQGIGSIRTAALFQGNTLVSNTPTINTGAGTIAFSGFTSSVADNGSANYSLRVTFNNTPATITDNTQLRVSVASAGVTAAASSSSTFGAFTTLTSSTATNDNRINAIATRVVFSPAPPTTAGVNSDFTVGAVAQDANGVTDTDFRNLTVPSVTLTISGGTGTLSAISGLTKTLVAGVASWSDAQYNTIESGLTLSTTNTGSLTNPTATISFVAFVGKLWDGGAGDGLWSSAANWSPDGVPTATDPVWLSHSSIASAYTVTVSTAGAVAKTLRIGDDGNPITLLLSGTPAADLLTIGSASGFDLSITNGGVLNNNANPSAGAARALAFATPTSDTWEMTGDGTFQYRQSTGSAPNITLGNTSFAATSNFEVYALLSNTYGVGTSGSLITRIRDYGNLLLQPSSSSTARLSNALNNGDKVVVRGNMTMVNTGLFVINRTNASSVSGIALRVIGNLSIGSGSTLAAGEDNTTAGTGDSITVRGNVSGTGQLTGATGSGTPSGVVMIGGNLTGVLYNAQFNNDQLVFNGGTAAVSDFNPNASSTFRKVTILKDVRLLRDLPVSNSSNTLTVGSTGTLNFNGFNVTGSAGFVLSLGGTLKITSADGIDATSTTVGNVRTSAATRTFPNGAVYWYSGTTPQVTGTGLPPTNGTKTIVIDNPTTVTLSDPLASAGTGVEVRITSSSAPATSQPSVTLGNLEIRQGTFIETATAEIVGAGSLKMTGGRYWMVKGVASGVPPTLPQLTGPYTLTGGSVALGGTANQSLRGGRQYYKLTFATSGVKTLTSAVSNVPDTVAVTGAAYLDLTQNSNGTVGAVGLTGAGALRMTGTSWLKTALTGTAPGMQGVYNLTGGTIEFANSSSTQQTVRSNDVIDASRTYNNVWVTGTNVASSLGNFAIRTGGTFTIKTGGNFSIIDQAITGPGSFVMESGTTLQYGSPNGITTVAGGGTGTSAGNIRVAGTRTYATNATYVVRGTGNSVTGDGLPASVTNLTLNKGAAGNEAALSAPVTITGALTFTEGLLVLQNASVTIAPGASIAGASSTRYVRTSTSPTATGKLIQRVPATATDVVFPVGTSTYTPARVRLTAASTADDFGVRVFDGVYTNGTSGSVVSTHVVNRTWDITEAVAGGSDAAVTFQWNDADVNITFNRFLCGVSHYLGGGIWDHILRGWAPATDLGGGVYERSRAGFTSFSPFAVQDGAMVLPVELVAFDAQSVGNKVQLTWATASESDNDRFEILRSADGRKFTKIGSVKGAGNSQQRLDYEFYDAAPLNGTAYYRLRQVDGKGQEQFSAVRVVTRAGATPSLVVWPNPATDRVTVVSAQLAGATLRVIDAVGRVVLMQQLTTAEASTELNITALPVGIYRLQVLPLNGPVLVQPLVKAAE